MEAQALERYIKSLLQIQRDRLRCILKLNLYKVFITSIITYACSACVLAAHISV